MHGNQLPVRLQGNATVLAWRPGDAERLAGAIVPDELAWRANRSRAEDKYSGVRDAVISYDAERIKRDAIGDANDFATEREAFGIEGLRHERAISLKEHVPCGIRNRRRHSRQLRSLPGIGRTDVKDARLHVAAVRAEKKMAAVW